MQDVFLKTYRIYGRALWSFAMVAGVCTFAIMIVITANALML